jgi:hypothetical protein
VVYYNRQTRAKTSVLPAQLDNFFFPRLVNLDVSNNRLTELPPAVLRHPRLKRLNLAHNRLGSLPLEFAGRPFDAAGTRGRVYLTALTSLRFAGNRIAALPPALFNLPQLTDLDCSINRIAAVPPAVVLLRKLRRLWLNSNAIETLPSNIDQCTTLQDLKLHGNPLRAPPLREAVKGVAHVFRWCREQYHLRAHDGRPPPTPALITYGPASEISILQPAQMKRMGDVVEAAKKTRVFNLYWQDSTSPGVGANVPPGLWGLSKLLELRLVEVLLPRLPCECDGAHFPSLAALVLRGNRMLRLHPARRNFCRALLYCTAFFQRAHCPALL